MFRVRLMPSFLSLLVVSACQLRARSSISLSVDLRDAPRKLLHTTEILPVQPGPLTLAFPEWIRNDCPLRSRSRLGYSSQLAMVTGRTASSYSLDTRSHEPLTCTA